MGARGMVFRAWAHERVPLNSQWLVLRIGGANFLHCWVADSIWLERAGSLITKQYVAFMAAYLERFLISERCYL